MKFRQCEGHNHQWSKNGLAACILGVALSPFAYIAIGALGGFAPAFSFIALPPLIACTVYLSVRFLSKPPRPTSSKRHLFILIVSWLYIFAFLAVVSGFSLLTTLERVGLFASLFLITTFLSLPVVILRRTALTTQMESLTPATATLLLILILVVTVVAIACYLLSPPAFI